MVTRMPQNPASQVPPPMYGGGQGGNSQVQGGMAPSPGTSMNQSLMSPMGGPRSVGSPMGGMPIGGPMSNQSIATPQQADSIAHDQRQDEQAYLEKVKQLGKYIEPLRKMINKIGMWCNGV